MPHALLAAKYLAAKNVRICWETNGMMHPSLLKKAVEYSVSTGGCIKFDLKAYDTNLHLALTGVSNERIQKNFKWAAEQSGKRPNPPLVIASTLLVPGYIDAEQVRKIAKFIASIDTTIPYSLLAFAPQFYMSDLPYTSTPHARSAEAAALETGLVNVRVGNQHLLGRCSEYE
jgi:pyruvate formate lyase activating enzyme